MSLRGQTVLLTGATGFLGSRLLRSLEGQGASIVALVLPDDKAPRSPQAKWIEIGSPISIIRTVTEADPDVVFHLAALSVYRHVPDQVPELVGANVVFGTCVLEGLRQTSRRRAKAPCLVGAGSFWQYAEGGSAYTPNSLYAATKQAFADICVYYRDMESVACMALILPDIYGEEDPRDRILNRLVKIPAHAAPIELSGGEQIVDLMHADDVVCGFEHAAELLQQQSASLQIEYFLHGVSPMRLRDVVDRLTAIRGYPPPVHWGAVPYRHREVMRPAAGPPLPGWNAKIALDDGLRRMVAASAQ